MEITLFSQSMHENPALLLNYKLNWKLLYFLGPKHFITIMLTKILLYSAIFAVLENIHTKFGTLEGDAEKFSVQPIKMI